MKQRIAKWDNAKFLLILMVVLGHFLDYCDTDVTEFRCAFLWIYSFHIPAFMLLSGLLSGSTLRSKFPLHRIGAYLVFYLMCNGMDALVRLALGRSVDLCLWGQDHYSWFMAVLPVFLLVTSLLHKLPAAVMIPLSILIGCLAGYSEYIGDEFYLSRILTLYPFFLMGFYWNGQTLYKTLQKWYVRLFSAVMVLGSMVLVYLYCDRLYVLRPLFTARNWYGAIQIPTEYGGLFRLGWYGLALILTLCFLSLVPAINTFFTDWGTRTLQVYVLHRPLLRLLIGIGYLSALQTVLPQGWQVVYLLSAAGLTMLLSIQWLEPPFTLFLGKKKKGA